MNMSYAPQRRDNSPENAKKISRRRIYMVLFKVARISAANRAERPNARRDIAPLIYKYCRNTSPFIENGKLSFAAIEFDDPSN